MVSSGRIVAQKGEIFYCKKKPPPAHPKAPSRDSLLHKNARDQVTTSKKLGIISPEK
jgi:hypothetical protein